MAKPPQALVALGEALPAEGAYLLGSKPRPPLSSILDRWYRLQEGGAEDKDQEEEEGVSGPEPKKLGLIAGVIIPCLLNICTCAAPHTQTRVIGLHDELTD